MSKYNRKTILDYIYGNDIEDYDIDELENDYEFMMEVIKTTHDKRIYKLCSDKVKNKYDFVRFMITEFKDDEVFIDAIANNYLSEPRESVEIAELRILLHNYIKDEGSALALKYDILTTILYSTKRIDIEGYRATQKNNHKLLQKLGMGFYLIFDEYHTSDITVNYFADRYLSEIFEGPSVNLETLLHEKFKSYKDIGIAGINTFMIRLINNYDPMLSSYVSGHVELLHKYALQIEKIKNRWDIFEKTNEQRKYNTIIEYVHKYVEEHVNTCSLTEIELLYYVGKKLDISDKICKYDGLDLMIYNEIMVYVTAIDEAKMSFQDIRHCRNIEKAITNILAKPVYTENIANRGEKPKCKVIKFDNKERE